MISQVSLLCVTGYQRTNVTECRIFLRSIGLLGVVWYSHRLPFRTQYRLMFNIYRGNYLLENNFAFVVVGISYYIKLDTE